MLRLIAGKSSEHLFEDREAFDLGIDADRRRHQADHIGAGMTAARLHQ
jgi:hypothetical protein